MRNLSFLLLLSLFALSCSKTDEPGDPQTGRFNITGVQDVDLSNSSIGSATITLNVTPVGAADTVQLSVDDIPNGVNVSFTPRDGITAFSTTMRIWTDFSGQGGTYVLKLRGVGHSGERTYPFKLTLAPYNGWQFGSEVFQKVWLHRNTTGTYKFIQVMATNGAMMRLSLPAGMDLPTKTTEYHITSDSVANAMQITLYDGPNIWSATGHKSTDPNQPATGQIIVDSIQKYIFKCSNVEMTNGIDKRNLDCNFME